MAGNSKPLNAIDATILPNGEVKIETGQFDGAVHMAAEKMLLWIQQELGGTTTKRQTHGHHHHHAHDHDHEHEGGGGHGHGHGHGH